MEVRFDQNIMKLFAIDYEQINVQSLLANYFECKTKMSNKMCLGLGQLTLSSQANVVEEKNLT